MAEQRNLRFQTLQGTTNIGYAMKNTWRKERLWFKAKLETNKFYNKSTTTLSFPFFFLGTAKMATRCPTQFEPRTGSKETDAWCQSGYVYYFSQSSGVKVLSWVCFLFLMKFQHSKQHNTHGSNAHFALKRPEKLYIVYYAGNDRMHLIWTTVPESINKEKQGS